VERHEKFDQPALKALGQQCRAFGLAAHEIGQRFLHKNFPQGRLALKHGVELGRFHEAGYTRGENFGGTTVDIFCQEGPVGQDFPASADTDKGRIAVFIQPPQADEAGLDEEDPLTRTALLVQRLAWAVGA
jgi:hypothetical protein